MVMSESQTTMLVGQTAEAVYLRVEGPATMRLGPQFVAACQQCRQQSSRHLFVDLSACASLDSTFAGCLIGQAQALRADAERRFSVVAPTEGCREALARMGLAQLLVTEDAPTPAELTFTSVEEGQVPLDALATTVIDAHERLAGVSDANRRTFGPVADAFRADLEKRQRARE